MQVKFRKLGKSDEELIWEIVYVTADMENTGETIKEAKKTRIVKGMFVIGESLMILESLQKLIARTTNS